MCAIMYPAASTGLTFLHTEATTSWRRNWDWP